ncbi:MAG: DNA alkylation repair protein [Sandaracinaceae bacterium]|nr:DNA alkylation repair protein [Sandaracinaceae bacterium]
MATRKKAAPLRIDVRAEVRAIERALTECAKPERAPAEKAYMKSALVFLGCGQPSIRGTGVTWAKAHPGVVREDLRALVDALATSDVYEHRGAAIAILARCNATLGAEDLPWLAELCRHFAMWAHVDWIAAEVVSPHMARTPSSLAILRTWAKDPSFWVRRLAILAQLRQYRRGKADVELLEEIAIPMLGEKEFFIRKAIGWALRELAYAEPERVRAFALAHRDAMSGLTFREATKHLGLEASDGGRPHGAARAR